jgi:hypothetical protein
VVAHMRVRSSASLPVASSRPKRSRMSSRDAAAAGDSDGAAEAGPWALPTRACMRRSRQGASIGAGASRVLQPRAAPWRERGGSADGPRLRVAKHAAGPLTGGLGGGGLGGGGGGKC